MDNAGAGVVAGAGVAEVAAGLVVSAVCPSAVVAAEVDNTMTIREIFIFLSIIDGFG